MRLVTAVHHRPAARISKASCKNEFYSRPCGQHLIAALKRKEREALAPRSLSFENNIARQRIVIANPLMSALICKPACRPESVSTAPFSFVSTIACAPRPTAPPPPAAT